MSFLGGLLGVGGSLLGGLFDDDGGAAAANAHNAGLNRMIQNLFRGAMVRQRLAYHETENRLRDRNEQVLGDLDRAKADIGGITRQTQRDIRDREKQVVGNATQSLVGSGLLNSSAAGNMQRGIMADTNRQIAQTNAQQAGMNAGINQTIAGVRSGLLSDVANLPVNQSGAYSSLINQYAAQLGQQGAIPGTPNTGGSGLGGLLGTLLGGSGGAFIPGFAGGGFTI